MTATRITVRGDSPYEVVIGTGVLSELPGLFKPGVRTVAVIHPASLPELSRPVCAALSEAGYDVVPLPVPDGEQAKTVEVAAQLWSALGRYGVTRSDAVVGVGGGATTDLAGFVAATWLRGVQVVLAQRLPHGHQLQLAEAVLAVLDEDVAHGLARDGLHVGVGVAETNAEPLGEQSAEGGLAGAGRADQHGRGRCDGHLITMDER